MLLTIDLGNYRASLGVFNDRKLVRTWSKGISSMRDLKGIVPASVGRHTAKGIGGVCISSVVPSADRKLRVALRRRFGIKPIFVDSKNAGIRILNYNRRQLGADRIAAAVAAREIYKRPVIVIDAGTAITIDLVNSKGEFAGGVIVPGLQTAAESLHRVAEKLPLVKIGHSGRIKGRDTRSAINSGIANGYAGMVDHLIREMKRESKTNASVVVTGGDAKLLKGMCRTIDRIHPHLVLEGLRVVWERNQ